MGAFILIIFFYYVTLLYAYLFSRLGRNYLYRSFYECGFKMISDMRLNLDIQFSILCLIFLLYDVEIIILVPILINISSLPYVTYFICYIVLIILAFSYYYEWDRYSLQWGFN